MVDENNIDDVIAQLAREQDKPSSDNYKPPKLKVEPTEYSSDKVITTFTLTPKTIKLLQLVKV